MTFAMTGLHGEVRVVMLTVPRIWTASVSSMTSWVGLLRPRPLALACNMQHSTRCTNAKHTYLSCKVYNMLSSNQQIVSTARAKPSVRPDDGRASLR